MTVAQEFVTIIIPFADRTAWSPLRVADVERALCRIGNPVGPEIAAALDKTGIIHFLSLNVIRAAGEGQAPHLLIEATVDGPAAHGVNAIAQALGPALVPVLHMVTGLTGADDVAVLLHRHADAITSGPLRWPGQAIGLPFCGTPGISVEMVRENQMVVGKVRELVGQDRLTHPESDALARLHRVAAALPAAERTVIDKPLAAPSFVDRPDAPWLTLGQSWGFATFARIAAYHWRLLAMLVGVPWLLLTFHLWRRHIGPVAASLTALAPALVVAGALVGIFAWLLRREEQANTPVDATPDPHALAAMLARENDPRHVQNHMISVTTLRPAAIRRLSLSVAFRAVATLIGTGLMRPGFLSTIGTIHAARWVRLPGTRQLVFVSNFDGSWESYLEDFIKKASEGVSAVWSNTAGFPRTTFLFRDGAADGDRMKRFARRSMQPTAAWYSAYPELSCGAIRKHALIVNGLRHAARVEAVASDAQAWLDLIGTVPRPATALQYDQIQAIAFGGMRRHRRSCMIAFDFGSAREPTAAAPHPFGHVQLWLADLHRRDLIVFGDRPLPTLVGNIAFSARGLARLGLDREVDGTTQGFPGVFASGMASEGRRRALGDPHSLDWSDAGIDAVLLLYARVTADEEAQALFAAEAANAERFGLSVHTALKTGLTTFDAQAFARRWHGGEDGAAAAAEAEAASDDEDNGDGLMVEPFGFVDGVSQPQVRGFPGTSDTPDPLHAIEPGEFILGYADNRGYFPPSPLVARPLDALGMAVQATLEAPVAHQPGGFPAFAGPGGPARDFGRNGSYLVIRQLHQNVAGFEAQLTEQAEALVAGHDATNPHPGSLARTREWIAAKMVGRWRDGSALVDHPLQPVLDDGQSALAANAFTLGTSDPQGLRCAYGAHIRRAFPRDSLSPGDALGLAVTNRHRLLRRGRPYRDAEGRPAGTLFMCLNADIERQFEFVQQTWLAAPGFHGLEGERDPFALHAADGKAAPGTFSIPGRAGGCVLNGLARHVTVLGGGYFFLPGRAALRFLAGKPLRDAESAS